jgi:hypothetical protein
MEKIISVEELKNEIRLLEVEQSVRVQLLKEQFFVTYENIKPVNLLKVALNNATSSPYLIENILGAAIGLTSGYLTKKIVVGASVNVFRKLLGHVLQFGVKNAVLQNSGTIKSIGIDAFRNIFHKKKKAI